MLPSLQVAIFTRARVCYTLCASSHPEEIKKTMSLKECTLLDNWMLMFIWMLNYLTNIFCLNFNLFLFPSFPQIEREYQPI